MATIITNSFKFIANGTGGFMPRSILNRLASTLNYLYTGRWLKDRYLGPKVRVSNRIELFKQLAKPIENKRVLYLEFGVWKGEATKLWSQLLKNPESRLHGFDSFEGLPEAMADFGPGGQMFEKGHFSTSGDLPRIADPRVAFFKGWFDETLPKYVLEPLDVLVINMDADLYSSTIYVLNALKPHIKVGTIIYFDEFWDPYHEQRAFSEFLDQSKMKFEALIADYGAKNVAFVRVK